MKSGTTTNMIHRDWTRTKLHSTAYNSLDRLLLLETHRPSQEIQHEKAKESRGQLEGPHRHNALHLPLHTIACLHDGHDSQQTMQAAAQLWRRVLPCKCSQQQVLAMRLSQQHACNSQHEWCNGETCQGSNSCSVGISCSQVIANPACQQSVLRVGNQYSEWTKAWAGSSDVRSLRPGLVHHRIDYDAEELE